MWGATGEIVYIIIIKGFQSTRPVWGATALHGVRPERHRISIHAPRVGRDLREKAEARFCGISIHAPRVGRDPAMPCRLTAAEYFNPRAPCGARRHISDLKIYDTPFQSTRPVWGATSISAGNRPCQRISIHAPRVGRDVLVLVVIPLFCISIHAPRVGRDLLAI